VRVGEASGLPADGDGGRAGRAYLRDQRLGGLDTEVRLAEPRVAALGARGACQIQWITIPLPRVSLLH